MRDRQFYIGYSNGWYVWDPQSQSNLSEGCLTPEVAIKEAALERFLDGNS